MNKYRHVYEGKCINPKCKMLGEVRELIKNSCSDKWYEEVGVIKCNECKCEYEVREV